VGGFLFLVLLPASRKRAGALAFGFDLPGDGAAVGKLQVELGMPE